jgi:hypothetical protein
MKAPQLLYMHIGSSCLADGNEDNSDGDGILTLPD